MCCVCGVCVCVYACVCACVCAVPVLSGYLMAFLGRASVGCDAACRLTWGFRLVLFWSYWAFVFILVAWQVSAKALFVRDRRRDLLRQARSDSDAHAFAHEREHGYYYQR